MTISNSKITATTPIQYLKNIGPYLAEVFQKKAIYTPVDLLFYLPIRYVDRRKVYTPSTVPDGKTLTFLAEVVSHNIKYLGKAKRRIYEILIKDDRAYMSLTFFKFYEGSLQKRFPVGCKVLGLGDVKGFRGLKSCVHPELEVWEDDEESAQDILPFYSLTEGLHQKTVRRIFEKNIEDLLTLVEEDPRSVRDESESVKISMLQALRELHFPPLNADVVQLNERKSPQHKRVIYDEFFYLQLGLISKRYKAKRKQAHVFNERGSLYHQALKNLPFELTGSQNETLNDIHADFKSGRPMNRLVQGDVGSGKTMVAFLSALMASACQVQTALMAPTEILAEQHFKKFFPFENSLGIRVELLTSSTPTKKRNQVLADLRQGVVNLIVGTHALLTPDVQFHKLGLAIIDEQHRFGVMQRAQLKNKAKFNSWDVHPHMLVMTATPIPRTLSMSVYGDLDVSIMREMPKGRQPIETKVFHEVGREKMLRMVESEIRKGRQAYFVYPLVEESEKLDLKNATDMFAVLKNRFADFKLGLLHGRMDAAEKEQIMAAFSRGELDLLVSTTVIEVGVDVPNATVMVIEHAERFGLSQLHQLRGRVGRGTQKSYCCLMAGYAKSREGDFRLKVMEETTDGFVIAEEDLKLRGPGEFLGTKQSGLPDFRLAELVRDQVLLTHAKKRAEDVLEGDPHLMDPKNAQLKKIMLERWGQKLDLVLA